MEVRTNRPSLNGILKQHRNFTALKPTNHPIQAGEFITLLGPSGSGKTTLLQIFSGLVAPSSSRMFFESKDWTDKPVNARGMKPVRKLDAIWPAVPALVLLLIFFLFSMLRLFGLSFTEDGDDGFTLDNYQRRI